MRAAPMDRAARTATEALASTLGPTIGGLLNASLNNAPEIIIALFALKNGLGGVAKGSITGSILAELLFGLGLACSSAGSGTAPSASMKKPSRSTPGCRPCAASG